MIFLPWQVKTLEMSYDHNKHSVLASAARSKRLGVFGVVVSGIEKDLTHQEVWNNTDSEFLRQMFGNQMHP